jgi:hypothetical protein
MRLLLGAARTKPARLMMRRRFALLLARYRRARFCGIT